MISLWKKAAFVLSAATLVAGTSRAQEGLRIAGNFTLEHSSSAVMLQFKKDQECGSNGSLVIAVFDNIQPEGAGQSVTANCAGAIYLTGVGMDLWSRTVPQLEAASLPGMFPIQDAACKVMVDPAVSLIEAKMADNGFTSLGLMELGSRPVTNFFRQTKASGGLVSVLQLSRGGGGCADGGQVGSARL